VAERAGDAETIAMSLEILGQERAAADRLAGTWAAAASASLVALDVVP